MIDIEVKNLTKTFLQPDSKNKDNYKYLHVLNNLNLEIKNNEVNTLKEIGELCLPEFEKANYFSSLYGNN